MAESTELRDIPPADAGRARRLASRLSRPVTWLAIATGCLVAAAYGDLLGLGTRYGFALGVEYWLFRPSDSAPLIIVAIAGWLLYRRSPRIRALSLASGSATLALPFYLVCFGSYAWAVYTGSLDMRVVSFTSFLFGSLALFYGRRGLAALWLPAAFMLFAVRVPAPLQLHVLYDLQMTTARYAGALLYWLGETAFVSGDQIIRAGQKFQVVEGCSGMRSLETLTMLTVLMADLFGRRGWHAVLLLLSAPIVAFTLNGVRVLTIVLNPHSDIATIHNAQGIAVLLAGLFLIYGFDELLERVLPERANPPFRAIPDHRTVAPGAPMRVLATTAAAAIGLLAIARFGPVWTPPRDTLPSVDDAVSKSFVDWPARKVDVDYNFLGSVRMDEHFHHAYAMPDGVVDVFIAKGSQFEVGSSVLSPMTLHPASGFEQVERLEDVSLPGGPAMTAHVMRRDKQEVLVWHAFLGRRDLLTESVISMLALERSPLRREAAPAVLRLSTQIDGKGPESRAAAAKKLQRTRDRLVPALQELALWRPD